MEDRKQKTLVERWEEDRSPITILSQPTEEQTKEDEEDK